MYITKMSKRDNMGLTGLKYVFSPSFHHEHTFFGKTKGVYFFKTSKTLCTVTYFLTETEYGSHGDEIRISSQFLSRTDVFP
jgi:hypothetical protein